MSNQVSQDPSMTIRVRAANQYGQWVYYPNCARAQTFAEIAGNKTLTQPVLARIQLLGYRVLTDIPNLSIHVEMER